MCEVVMGANRKAILAHSKALHTEKDGSYYQAMLSTSADLAARLQVAFDRTKMSQAEFARACGASRQGVRSWLTTGRIAKGKLVTFAQVTGVSIEELLGQGPPAPAAPPAPVPAPRAAAPAPAPAAAPSDYDLAHLMCKAFRQVGASECEVDTSVFSTSYINATLALAPYQAHITCNDMAATMRQSTNAFAARRWEIRIYSPFSGNRPIASCEL